MRQLSLFFFILGCSDYELHSPYTAAKGGLGPNPEGVETPRQRALRQHSWTVTQSGGIDVLFFGDTSGSMDEEL